MSRWPTVAGQSAADRLMGALALTRDGRDRTHAQVAVVLHALADHSALEAARQYRYAPGGHCPRSQSIGRWLHDVADHLEELDREVLREARDIDPIRARLAAMEGDDWGPGQFEMLAALRAVLDGCDLWGLSTWSADIRRLIADALGVNDA